MNEHTVLRWKVSKGEYGKKGCAAIKVNLNEKFCSHKLTRDFLANVFLFSTIA